MIRILLGLCFAVWATMSHAVQPDEILDDPVLEQRARDISKDLRCLVCKSESIDESNSSLARDLRLLVRERLVVGDSNQEVKGYIVDRYGEFALLKPKIWGSNLLLWAAGPLLLLISVIMGFFYLRSRSNATDKPIVSLSDEEKNRLSEILDKN